MDKKLITLGSADTLAHRRMALTKLTHKKAVKKLFEVISPKCKARPGGYLRIRRTSRRVGDRAEMAVISFIDLE